MLFDKGNDLQPRDEAVDTALKALADYDIKNAALLQAGEDEKTAQVSRRPGAALACRREGVQEPRGSTQLQQASRRQSGRRPTARVNILRAKKPLEQIIADGGKLGSYAAYSMIDAEFAMSNNAPNANILANQKQWMADLEEFLTKFPNSDEVPSVLLHLANANEFNAEEKKAREQYGKLVKDYAATEAGKKAAGALRRLDLAGQSLAIKGPGLQNETVDTSQYLGKPVLIVFWASWNSQVKADLPDLIKVYDKYHGRGLQMVGVNVDNERAEVDAFVKENKLTWPQIFEPGGMDSRLATDFCIISLPTLFLVDGQGKVVSRNLRAAELDKQVEKLLPAKEPGVADRRQ